jgi:hypothetical protein
MTTPSDSTSFEAAATAQQQSFNDDDAQDVPAQEQERKTVQVQAESFITTTDIMTSLNKALSDLSSPEELKSSNNKPHFELQRRLQDGSTRRATPKEQAANDCETQIQQAVQLLSDLKSNRERLAWAEAQRSFGNHLYQHKEYEQAIDVYLTCLPAVAHDETFRKVKQAQENPENDDEMAEDASGVEVPTTASTSTTSKDEEDDDDELKKERLLLFVKLLNNLAQSTLQLGWYKKTEHFCTLAFEHLEEEKQAIPTLLLSSTALYQEQRSKLYFRRAKARRLRGDYALSRTDLDHAMNALPTDSGKEEEQRAAIQKELQLLQKSAAEARKNHDRQKKALQRVMAPPSTSKTTRTNRKDDGPKASSTSVRFEETTTTGGVLFPGEQQEGPLRRRPRKNYSTLRALRPQEAPEEDEDAHHDNKLSPWQHYVAVIGKIAEKILEWMGDEEYSPSTGGHHAKVD